MELTITEALELDYVKGLIPLTDTSGFSKRVSSVGILDFEILDDYEVFKKGEFLITTFSVAKDNDELVFKAIKELVKREIAGLAIKAIYFKNLNRETLDYANKHHFPIFTFETIFIEDIINSINSVVYTNQIHDIYETKVNSIIGGELSDLILKRTIDELSIPLKDYYAFYLSSYSHIEEKKLIQYANRFRKYRDAFKNFWVMKYKTGLIIVTPSQNDLRLALKELAIQSSDYYIGCSHYKENIYLLGQAINEALIAARHAKTSNEGFIFYQSLGINKLLIPISNSQDASTYYNAIISPLVKYDDKYNSKLIETLRAYFDCSCNTQQAAKSLYTHPNTVLYRIKKAKEIAKLNESDFNSNVELSIALKLYDINKSN